MARTEANVESGMRERKERTAQRYDKHIEGFHSSTVGFKFSVSCLDTSVTRVRVCLYYDLLGYDWLLSIFIFIIGSSLSLSL
jgi:hypothetical protein